MTISYFLHGPPSFCVDNVDKYCSGGAPELRGQVVQITLGLGVAEGGRCAGHEGRRNAWRRRDIFMEEVVEC